MISREKELALGLDQAKAQREGDAREEGPPCDDCGEQEAERAVVCPVDEDLRLDLCRECYEERGPGLQVCHVRRDSNWEVNGGRAPAQLEGAEKRHMNSVAYPTPGWIGNPYEMAEDTIAERQRVLTAFKHDLLRRLREETLFPVHLAALRSKQVACWCRTADEERSETNACHLDVVEAALLGLYATE